jgi:hypothetical protein
VIQSLIRAESRTRCPSGSLHSSPTNSGSHPLALRPSYDIDHVVGLRELRSRFTD